MNSYNHESLAATTVRTTPSDSTQSKPPTVWGQSCQTHPRRFNILTVQFLICSDCHPFWGHIVGMRKPGLLEAEWFCAFRTCCPTFRSNIFIICFILNTLSVPGHRLKNIKAYYIHFLPCPQGAPRRECLN